MENKLLDNEIEINNINNIKALVFKINYPTLNFVNHPKFRKWLELQKRERGNNGFIAFCRKCNLFFYFMDEFEEKETKKKCCNDFYYVNIVENYILMIHIVV